MVSCQKGPTRHAYAWQIGPFWQDTLDITPDNAHSLITQSNMEEFNANVNRSGHTHIDHVQLNSCARYAQV